VHAVGRNALHRGDHHIVRCGTLASEDTVGAESYAGSDAPRTARHEITAGADNAGDVGAVTVAIVWKRVRLRHWLIGRRAAARVIAISDKIPARDDTSGGKYIAVAAGHAIAAEVGVIVIKASVHDRDLDASPGEAKPTLGNVGTGHRQRRLEVWGGPIGFWRLDDIDRVNRFYARETRDGREPGGIDSDR
jgi:hypothetical protein